MIVVYTTRSSGWVLYYLLLYVDNIFIACKDMSEINTLKAQLSGEFEIKDLGVAKKILGRRFIKT